MPPPYSRLALRGWMTNVTARFAPKERVGKKGQNRVDTFVIHPPQPYSQ